MIEARARIKVRLPDLRWTAYDTREVLEEGLAEFKAHVAQGLGSDDDRMKPLSRGYLKQKISQGLPGLRNMIYSGAMLDNLTVRWATDNRGKAALTSRLQRQKAHANELLTPWLSWSPELQGKVADIFRRILRRKFAE